MDVLLSIDNMRRCYFKVTHLLILLLIFGIQQVSAQYVINVFQKDGRSVGYLISDIDSISIDTVSPNNTISHIVDLSFQYDSIFLKIDSTFSLETVVEIDGFVVDDLPLQWSSDRTDVVTVSTNGVVTGISSGVATITAEYEGMVAKCLIYVIDNNDNKTSLFSINELPTIFIRVDETEWNTLLDLYDLDKHTKDYVKCDFVYAINDDSLLICDSGLRLHGASSRRRPEGWKGQHHNESDVLRHCHYMVNFRKYDKTDGRDLYGYRKLLFKWFHNDPSYVREIYSYDLFKRYGIWTIADASYARLFLRINDEEYKYFGVYSMLEVVDKQYIKKRIKQFESADGFLWKCEGVGLNDVSDSLFFIDDNTTVSHPYELKEGIKDFEAAKNQLSNFIENLNTKDDADFKDWISSICDVELLLKTYAVNVALGNWDDYWNNSNNYYIYFNSKDAETYQFFFIPTDYDECLGRTRVIGNQTDAVTQDPLNWGVEKNKLISRIIHIPEYKEMYVKALKELASSTEEYISPSASRERIIKWQNMIAPYVSNDTDEDMLIEDIPGKYTGNDIYRLMDFSENNFFDVKCRVINNICE